MPGTKPKPSSTLRKIHEEQWMSPLWRGTICGWCRRVFHYPQFPQTFKNSRVPLSLTLNRPRSYRQKCVKQHYARFRAVQRRLTDEAGAWCNLVTRRVVRTKTERTLVLVARRKAWSGGLTVASLVTPQSG